MARVHAFVTPLVFWLVVNLYFVAWRVSCSEGLDAFGVAWRVCLAVACALAWHARPDGALTLQDRALMHIKDLLDGDAPVAGQVCVALYVDDLPTVAAVVDVFEPIAVRFERFHKIPDHAGKFMWEGRWKAPPRFDVRDHVAADDATGDSLDAVVTRLANAELPEDRPPWRFDLVDCRDGRAVLFRLSHAVGDGLRLLKIGNEVLRFADGSAASIATLSKMSKNKDKHWDHRPSLRSLLGDVVSCAVAANDRNEATDAFHPRGAIFDGAVPRAHLAAATVELADVLDVRARLPKPCSLNDVILTAFCGAARKYAERAGDPAAAGALVRAMVAVSLPDDRARRDCETYNDFVMPSTPIPVFVKDRAARLRAVQDSMKALKVSRAGVIQTLIVAIFERLGLEKVAGATQKQIFGKHSFVYSNLPGYEQPVFFAKKKVSKFGIFFPNMITQVVFFSYDGTLSLSVSTDAAYLKDPHLLNTFFHDEIADWKLEVEKKRD